MKKIYILLTIFITISTITFAHSGRTDSNGGHYDRSTGEYHYHNGGSTQSSSFLITENSESDEQILELKSQKEELEDEIYELKEKLNQYNSELEDAGFNTIEDISNELNKKEDEISNMWCGFIITFIIGIAIAYNKGINKNTKVSK